MLFCHRAFIYDIFGYLKKKSKFTLYFNPQEPLSYTYRVLREIVLKPLETYCDANL